MSAKRRQALPRAAWVLALWAAYLSAPLLHVLEHAPHGEEAVEDCSACGAEPDGPQWVASCDASAPCGESDHHHHSPPKPHDGSCSLCLAKQSPHPECPGDLVCQLAPRPWVDPPVLMEVERPVLTASTSPRGPPAPAIV